MSSTINVTLSGYSSSGLNDIEQALQDDYSIEPIRKLLREGGDLTEELPTNGDVLILELGDNWRELLGSIAPLVRRSRIPLIVIGPDGDAEMVRFALKAGARDFQTRPVVASELRISIKQLADESQNLMRGAANGSLAVFMSAKGGAGASAIVAALGNELASRKEDSRTLLVDLDLQYGNLPLYFDKSSDSRLSQSLISNERIDSVLLDACLVSLSDGYDLLASCSEQVFSAWDIQQAPVASLINLVCEKYDQVLVDIPRQVDPITFQAIEKASHVNIVMQQTLSDLRYTQQIIKLLREQGISNDRMRVIVNRHDKHRVLRTIDIIDAFEGIKITTLPNDYKRMSYATGNAVSLVKKYKSALLTKSIKQLSENLFPSKMKLKRTWYGAKRLVSA